MLKAEFVFTCIFGISSLARWCTCRNINQVRWVKFIPSYVRK